MAFDRRQLWFNRCLQDGGILGRTDGPGDIELRMDGDHAHKLTNGIGLAWNGIFHTL